MDDFLILLLGACLCHVISTQSDVRLPPYITRSPREKNTVYEREKAFTLECSAEGTPAVRYEWKKNGFVLNTNHSNIRNGSDSTMTIDIPTETDEGYYQCFAKNQYGTALSNMIDVRMAFLNFSTEHSTVLQKTIVEGMPFHIQAGRERSFPKPHYDWYKASEIDSITLFTPLSTSRRIQVAENGDLHFAHALPEDAFEMFSCSIYNPYLKINAGGCNTQITVTRSKSLSQQYIPVPTISWIRPGNGKVMPTGRYWLGNENTELAINITAASDEGDYICTASNTQGNVTHTLQLRVGAKPELENTIDGPYNVNITEGETVTFNCNPYAIPEANIIWLQNGQAINTDNPPTRFVFSNDKKSLTIRDVCRDCVDRESKTDLTVIQCNASNVHGYAFTSGYLNVLKKTTVTISGSKTTSDPSTPPTVRWYKTEPFRELVRDERPYVYVTKESLIIVISPNCSSECGKYLGEYRCIGDNGYSRGNQTITISYQYRPSTDEHITTDITKNALSEDITRNKATWALWKIILVAAAIGLVLFLIGIFLDDRWKRHFGGVNKETVERRIPNPDGIYEDIGYDSIGFPLEEIDRAMRRESSEYDDIGYDSIDQVLDDIGNSEDEMTHSPDVREHNGYGSLDVPQREAMGRGRQMLENDIACDDMVQLMPLEEDAKSDLVSKEMNQYLELISDEVNPHLDVDQKEENPYLDLVPEEVD